MKLAIVIPGFQADERDWCIPAFTNLAHELAKSVELHVFALRYPGVRGDYRVGQVHVHALGGGILAGQRVPLVSLLNLWRDAARAVGSEHRKTNFQTIIGIWATESGWLATRIAKRLGVPSLVHLAGGELTWVPEIGYGNQQRGLARLLVRKCLQGADMLTAPSAPMKSALLSRRDIGPEKVTSWALGVDTDLFSPCEQTANETRERPFTFVTVGSLVPVKGHSWLIKGAAELRKNAPDMSFRLDIVGAGPLLPDLRRLVGELHLQGYVNFRGEVRHEQLPQLLRQADCFLLGSLHEAQCMAALEAMSCGLPWIGPPARHSLIAPCLRPVRVHRVCWSRKVALRPLARGCWRC